MKKNLLSIIFLIGMVTAIQAQITVTNSIFPQVGDDFDISIANSFAPLAITPAGGNQTWDFTALTGTSADFTVGDATTGAAAAIYPTAHIIIPEFGGVAGDGYVKVDANEMSTVGVIGSLAGFVSNFPIRYDPIQVEIQTPLMATSSFSSSYAFIEAIDPHDPPGTAIDTLITNIELQLLGVVVVDSVRVIFTANRQSDVDAWGTVNLPNASFDVLRLRSFDITNTQVEAKVTTLGLPNPNWQTPADLGIDVSAFPFIGQDTVVSYDFWNDTEKMPIVSMTTAPDGTTIEYAAYLSSFATSTEDIRTISTSVRTYPNPAYEELNIELKNFDNGNYTLKMYNIIGKQIWKKTYFVNEERTIKLDVSKLRKGTYIYTIFDEKGRNITTRRVMVIKP